THLSISNPCEAVHPCWKSREKTLNPPPVLYVSSLDSKHHAYMHHPNLHIRAALVSVNTLEVIPLLAGANLPLSGTIEQSIIKLNDENRNPHGFFIFSDLSVRLMGRFCIRFILYESRKGVLRRIHTVFSNPFEVVHHKVEIPVNDPTPLTLALRSQGVKLRTNFPPKRTPKRPLLTQPTTNKRYQPSSILPTPSSHIHSPTTNSPLIIYHASRSLFYCNQVEPSLANGSNFQIRKVVIGLIFIEGDSTSYRRLNLHRRRLVHLSSAQPSSK
ncbi:hypothetical protein L0F63_003512, partial [Massospora cicadina]